jgi:UDP-N-acetylmuramate dehydrogenase
MFEVSSAKDLRGFWAKDYPLARHNSWHIGGPASYVYKPQDLKDCQRFYAWLHQVYPGVKTIWLGLGSNVLVPDAGVDAIVVLSRYGLNTLTHEPPYIRAEAGVTCAKFAKLSEKLSFEIYI